MSNKQEEKVSIKDKHGFNYIVLFEHQPQMGFTTVYYNDNIIAQSELGKVSGLREPETDDDWEWERYQETLSEWTDEIKSILVPRCEEYFNTKHKNR